MVFRITELQGPRVEDLETEVVERKGLGHPDSICDATMEAVSVALCRAYRERFGRILHHNCDKGLLVAGAVERRLGGGRVLEPMRLVIGDRASSGPGLTALEVSEIATGAAKAWIRAHLRHVDAERHVRYQPELRGGSTQLAGIFREEPGGAQAPMLGANDTSAAVGYAPLSPTERLVLEAERLLNGLAFKARFPLTGEDVKVMAVRSGVHLDLTVAMPFLDSGIEREAQYFQAREEVVAALEAHLLEPGLPPGLESLAVGLNALDRRGAGLEGMYLSVLGTSAEDADSGEVGRGNRVNGLLSLCRPVTLEAAAGKNPVSHVGKIYNVLSHHLARRLHEEVPGVEEASVLLVSRIGEPVDHPGTVSVALRLSQGRSLKEVEQPASRLVHEQLERLPVFCGELAEGRYPVC